jgi:hypothetical protein
MMTGLEQHAEVSTRCAVTVPLEAVAGPAGQAALQHVPYNQTAAGLWKADAVLCMQRCGMHVLHCQAEQALEA